MEQSGKSEEVKFKNGVAARGAVGLGFKPRSVGDRVEPRGEPCHWVMLLSHRDETLCGYLNHCLFRGPASPSKGQPWWGERVSNSPRGTMSNKGGIAEQATSASERRKDIIDVRAKRMGRSLQKTESTKILGGLFHTKQSPSNLTTRQALSHKSQAKQAK